MVSTPGTKASKAPVYDGVTGYPYMLRGGHKYEIALGQRLALGGFKGPMDLAIGPEELYVVNRFTEAGGNVATNRFVRVNVEDDGYEDNDIYAPGPDGEFEPAGNESLPSWVMCEIDQDEILYVTDEHANKVARFTIGGDFLGTWGEAGEGPGELNAPSGIAIGRDGTVWVTSSRSHRVEHFTNEGAYIGGFGGYGDAPGELDYPWGLGIDPINGTILVADWRNDRVQRFSPDGEVLQVLGESGSGPGQMNRPSDVAVDQYGDIYVADRSNHRGLMFNPRGGFLETFIGDATLNERGLRKLMTNLDMLRMRENVVNLDSEKRFLSPTAVKVDAENRVYWADTGRYRIQIYRKICKVLGPDDIDPPTMFKDPALS